MRSECQAPSVNSRQPGAPPSETRLEITDPWSLLQPHLSPRGAPQAWFRLTLSLPASPPRLPVGGPLRLDWPGEFTNGELREADPERHQLEEDKQISSWLRLGLRVGEGQQVRFRPGGAELVRSHISQTGSSGPSCRLDRQRGLADQPPSGSLPFLHWAPLAVLIVYQRTVVFFCTWTRDIKTESKKDSFLYLRLFAVASASLESTNIISLRA